jgi:hypothetical protein
VTATEGPRQEASGRVGCRFAPLFVLAPARSYSSLIVAMLGRHPELYGFPELRLFRATRVAELLLDPAPSQGAPASERLDGLLRALAQLHDGQQTVESVSRAYGWLERRTHWGVETVFDHLLELVSPLTGVEKSPETSRTDDALRRASAAYPRARILHLVRHPWSTVRSMLEAWSSLPYWGVDEVDAPQYCLNVWLEQHCRIAAFGRSLGSGQFIRLRSEDVVDRPLDVLAVFCRWMGIDDGDDSILAMMHPERSPFASHGPVNAGGGYDPKFLTNPRLRCGQAPPLAVPDEWRVDAAPLRTAVDLARQFGYDCHVGSSSPDFPPPIGGFRRIHPFRLGLPRRH